jgi:hypothetical protein
MTRVLDDERWAMAWAFAGGFLLVSAYALAGAAMAAIASDPAFAGTWCGPAPHAAIGGSTVFGHCARCWPALACAALGAAALLQAGSLLLRARR